MSVENPGGGGISLRDLQNAHAEGSLKRVCIDAITNHDDLLDDVRFFQASDGDRDITEYIAGQSRARHYILGEGKLPTAGSRQRKSFGTAHAYVLFQILRDKYEKLAQKGREQEYLNQELRTQTGALGQLLVQDMLYGDRADDPKGFNGLSKYYDAFGNGVGNKLSTSRYVLNAFDAISGLGESDKGNLRRMHCVIWGQDAIKPIYPEGANDAGLNFGSKMDDVAKTAANGGTVHYLEREMTWSAGLAVAGYDKYAALVNIPVDHLLDMVKVNGVVDRDATLFQGGLIFEKIDRFTSMVKANPGQTANIYMDDDCWRNLKVLSGRLTRELAVREANENGKTIRTLNGVRVRINESQNFAHAWVPAAA